MTSALEIAAEVQRLRAALGANTPTLTDAEREAIAWFAAGDETCYGWGWKRRSETLRGLLDRLSPVATGDNDRPEAIDRMSKPIAWLAFATDASESSFVTLDKDEAEAAARDWGWSVVPLYAGPQNRIVCDTKMHTTPAKGSVQPEWMMRPYWVDPPAGHRYGFPKLYDPVNDGNMTAWMVANGYPQHLADKGLNCTFTST